MSRSAHGRPDLVRTVSLVALALGASLSSACVGGQCECASASPAAHLTIQDATNGMNVGSFNVAIDGTSMRGVCTDNQLDAASGCGDWVFPVNAGHHTFTVTAPGYASQTFAADFTFDSNGCCSQGTQLVRTVSLTAM